MKDLVKLNFPNELARLLNTYHKDGLKEGDVELAHTPSRLLFEVIETTTALILQSNSYAKEDIERFEEMAANIGQEFLHKNTNYITDSLDDKIKEEEINIIPFVLPLFVSYVSQRLLHSCITGEEILQKAKE